MAKRPLPRYTQTRGAPMGDSINVKCEVSDLNEELRIVLTGRTGNGKSATGNTLLNQKTFTATRSPVSVTSECSKARGTVHGRRIAVIDTPGIFDTKFKECEVVRKLKTCISLASPGPHVFLIVIRLDRFTEEEQKSVELIQEVFGERAAAYSMVLFTYGDQLENVTLEDFIGQSPKLTSLIQKCDGRYHVFNNKNWTCRQVPELLMKIQSMVSLNGGGYYTNHMFEEAERAIEEAARTYFEDTTDNRRREENVLRAKLKGEKLQSKLRELYAQYKVLAREMAEKKNKYIYPEIVVAGAELGLTVGAGAGSVAGPVGAGVGAVVGILAGAALGLMAPAAVVAIKNHCVTQ